MRTAALAALLIAAAPVPAMACSVADSYRVPTNLELAGQADTILVAKVIGSVEDADSPLGQRLVLHPIEAVKGTLPEADIEIDGLGLAQAETAEYGVLSNPYELERAHPLSYIGACIRYLFPRGTTALFFLKRDGEGAWRPAGGPFSRWAEDVPGTDWPWVQLSQLYAHAADMPSEQRSAMLAEQRDALLARMDEPVAQLMAADIARQMEGPNEPWNTRMQRELGLLGFADDAGAEKAGSAIEEALEAMRTEQD